MKWRINNFKQDYIILSYLCIFQFVLGKLSGSDYLAYFPVAVYLIVTFCIIILKEKK